MRKRGSKLGKLVLDTGVIVEYLDEESPYADRVGKLYADVLGGKITAYVTPVTI